VIEVTEAADVQEQSVCRRLWTRDEYEQMIEHGIFRPDERLELIAGEIVALAPQKSPHATAISLGLGAFIAVIRGAFHIRIQLPLALGADSEPEPDIAIVTGSARDYRDAHPSTAALVVEIADSSVAFDRNRKGSLYARAGIPEYWIVNLQSRMLEVYRDPAPDPAAPLGYAYRQRLSLGPEARMSLVAIPGAEIMVADLLP
jgi:Uma2 family endonuclease